MAKVGEGDPRWIVANVEETNVNKWHWTEKSLFPWAKAQIEQSFKEKMIFETATHKAWFVSVDSFKGDLFVNNRKGKKMFVWDVNMDLTWKGEVKGAEKAIFAEGKMICTDITVTDDDFESRFTLESENNANGKAILDLVKSHAVEVVKKGFSGMIKKLNAEHQYPDQSSAAPSTTTNTTTNATSSNTTKAPDSSSDGSTKTSAGLTVRTFDQTIKFETTGSLLFEALLDPQRVSAFTGSAAQISSEKGSTFKLFGGSVQGILEDVIPGKKIAQKWRFASWPADHYSQVTIAIEDKGGNKCLVKLTQTGVPESDFDRTRFGWEEHFWHRIKGVFGWNYKVKA